MLTGLYFVMQFLLVDLRCHGDSTLMKKRVPHTVASAALDVLKLVGNSWPSLFFLFFLITNSWPSFVRPVLSMVFCIFYQHNIVFHYLFIYFCFVFVANSATPLIGKLFFIFKVTTRVQALVSPHERGMPCHWSNSGLAGVFLLKPPLIAFFH